MGTNFPQNQQHDDTIQLISERLLHSGYSVLADHINWAYGKPLAVEGVVPDIFAFNQHETIIYEVQTKDTFQDRSSLDKLRVFSKKSAYKTILVIPLSLSIGLNEHISKAQELIKKYNLNVQLASCDLKRKEINFIQKLEGDI
ncbi:hypothetical protein [Paenibacillus sp. PAMC 26794]|uniref:hypothetical protein n=1 Tax=Paenibacillus sp. PAMC 26794 TaxID=1257080 RepID=UPI00037A0681|nr:hypothetical protein [Paenibacillus sp. PAMC 26794]